MVYSVNKLQIGNGPNLITVEGWFAVLPEGLKPMCQNGIKCVECTNRQNDAVSTDVIHSCGQCDFKHHCHAIMLAHIHHEKHNMYF